MSSEIHENDIGTKLIITIIDNNEIVDLSSALALDVYIRKPNDTILSRIGTLETDGTDGKLYYIIVAGDIDEAGMYKLQCRITLPNGVFYSSIVTFKVHCNL